MSIRALLKRREFWRRYCSVFLLAGMAFSGVLTSYAQQHIKKNYPTRNNVRVVLKNLSGTITVESWDRDQIKLSATLEAPAARITPRMSEDEFEIDVMGDNRGRGDIGNVNFKLQVPAGATVDLQTRQGDIHVSNINGDLVRAHVSLEGDIELTGISAKKVIAQNTMGLIFFDGQFTREGNYSFQSTQGNITIRIPQQSAFYLSASSQAKRITLGEFWTKDFKNMGDGRKYEGGVRGQASVTVINFLGSITFMRR